jgi:PPOX class probable F420-dependent enzyme
MNIDDLTPLLAQNQVVNFSTYRRDGRQQMSLVTVGRVGDALAFTTRQRNAKYSNLLRDPRCAMMVMSPDLRVYAVLDGDAQVVGPHNTDTDVLRTTLREVYRVSAGKEHPNWDEYDAVMVEQKRVAILLAPTRMYAHGL